MEPQREASLTVLAFHPRERRVKCIEFHPVLPLIALADKDDVIQLWNYESQEVVFEAQLGGVDDAAQVELQLQTLAEKDVKFFGPSLADRIQVSKTPTGSVKSLVFCDIESLYWEAARQAGMRGVRAPTHDPTSMSPVMKGTRILIAVCEQKAVMLDLVSGRSIDIPRVALEAKSPTAIAILREAQPDSAPVACVGCSDGVIRCVQLGTNKLIMRLTGLKVGPTCMLPLCGGSASGGDKLLTGSGDGSLALWDPLMQQGGAGGVKEVTPAMVQKAQEGAVVSMALAPPGAEQPLGDPTSSLRLISLGADSRVAIWSLAPLRELSRAKPLAKVQLHSVLYSPRGQAGTGMEAGILLAGTGNQIYAMWESGSVEKLVDLTTQIPSGSKKVVRAGLCVASPTKPHLLAVGTGSGMALLSFGRRAAPPAMLTKSMKGGVEAAYREASGVAQLPTFVLAKDNSLWSVDYGLDGEASGGGTGSSSPAPAPLVKQAKPVARLLRGGAVELSLSACSQLLAACWPGANTYALYRCSKGAAQWEQIESGSADSVAWAHHGTMFATASVPVVQPPSMDPKGKGKRRSTGAAEMEAALAAAREAAASSAAVSIKEVDLTTNKVNDRHGCLGLRGKVPRNVHGGALLGVTYRQPLHSAQGGNAFQFYSWATQEATGEVFPEPRWVRWDSYAELCAIGYPSEVLVCRCRPRLERIASLAIPGVSSAMWHVRQLYLASPDAVDLVFVDAGGTAEEPYDSPRSSEALKTPPPPALPPLVKATRLASLQLPQACSRLSSKFYRPSAQQAETAVRPFGALQILCVHEAQLWLVDGWGQPRTVDLSHPSLRLQIQVASGREEAARQGAVHGMLPETHETAAAFLASMSEDGARQALGLPGVSVRGRLGLSMQARELAGAQSYLHALSCGITDPVYFKPELITAGPQRTPRESSETPSPPGSPWGKQSPALPTLSEDGNDLLGMDDVSGTSSPAARPSALELTEMCNASLPTNDDGSINWDGTLPRAPDRESFRRRVAASSMLPHALRLVDEALESGDHPVAARCMAVLADAAGSMQANNPMRHAVQLRMVQCGMGDAASSLLTEHKTMAKATSRSHREAVLGAALTGDAGLVGQLVEGAGAEAALYHQSWGNWPQLQASLSDWNAQLRRASCGVFEVSPSH